MPALALVVKGYPRLSETFIAQELKGLEARGFSFDIWSLRRPHDARVHPVHGEIRATARYLPEYLHREPRRVWRAARAARRLQGFGAAWRCWLADLRRDPTRNRVRRFGQACVLASELGSQTRFIYAHFLHTPASVARYAAMMRGLGWGVSAHARDIWTTPDWDAAEKLAEARFAVTCTAAGAARLGELAPQRARVRLAYHGLDLSTLPTPPERGAHDGALRLVSVGRLVEKKGYDVLLDALARLPAGLDWRLTHIGGGPLARPLAAEATRLGLSARIDWRGAEPRGAVIEAMRRADLFVLPARAAADGDRDGLPNVLMEAASQELAILSTRFSAIPEFVENGRHGLLVAPGDAQALAEGIARLAANPGERAAMGRAARARLVARFGAEEGIARISGLLSEALDPEAPLQHVAQ